MAHVANVVVQASSVPGDLTNFVLYIDLSAMPVGFWSTVANGGGDIRVYKEGGVTELAREVVSCSTTTETGELWVRYGGTLSASVDTTIEIHADGTSLDYAVGATYGRNAVWQGYLVVLHGAGTDSTGNEGAFAGNGTVTVGGASGKWGTATDYDGVDDYLREGTSVDQNAPITIGAWAYPHANQFGMWSGDNFVARWWGPHLYIDSGTKARFAMGDGAGSNHVKHAIGLTTVTLNSWSMFHGVAESWTGAADEFRVYLNGTEDGTSGSNTTADVVPLGQPDVGRTAVPSVYYYANGLIGHIYAYDGALTADWISAEHANQNSPAAFYTVSAPASGGITGTGAAGTGAAQATVAGSHPFAGTGQAASGAAFASAGGSYTPAGVSGSAGVQTGSASVAISGSYTPDGVSGSAAVQSGPASATAIGRFPFSGGATLLGGSPTMAAMGAFPFMGICGTDAAAAAALAGGSSSAPAGTIHGHSLLGAQALSVQAWGLASAPPNLTGIGAAYILEVGLPYSVNSIINGALDLIASNGIQGLGDSSSHVGNSIKRSFDVERDALLREYPWNFAMRRATLAASATAPAFRFAHAYELPAGPDPEYCLRVWAVGDEESRLDSDVWEISGRKLLTDLAPPLPIRYIGRIVNPALWDALAVKAFEARLAWQAAYLASGSAALAEQMARIYRERLEAAKSVDAQEGTPEPFEDGTTWLDSRQVGTW